MSFLDDFVDTVEDIGEGIGDAVGDAVDWAGEAISDAVDWMGEAASDIADVVGDVAEAAVAVHEATLDAIGDAGDAFLTACDDVGLFEVVQLYTYGLVDIEYSEAGFSFNYGIEDVFGYGFSVGEGGFSADYDTFGSGGAGISWNEDGFAAHGRVGMDWGPLPNYGGEVTIDDEGDFGVNGKIEAYLPTPAGAIGGELEGAYQETDEGFAASGSLTGKYMAASGTTVGAGVHGSYEENAEGYIASGGVHASIEQIGGPEVTASVDYTESRQGDVRTSGVTTGAEVEYAGVEAGGTAGVHHVETSEGEFDVVTGTGHVEAAGQSADAEMTVTSGPDGTTVMGAVSGDTGLDAERMMDEVAEAAGVELPEMPEVPELPDLPDAAGVPTQDDVEDAATDAAQSAFDEAADEAAEQLGL